MQMCKCANEVLDSYREVVNSGFRLHICSFANLHIAFTLLIAGSSLPANALAKWKALPHPAPPMWH